MVWEIETDMRWVIPVDMGNINGNEDVNLSG